MHPSQFTATFDLPDEAATQRLGASLAQVVVPGTVVYLEGDLGAGKTTLARSLIRALGHVGPVKSPTYALVEVYVVSSLYLYHFDFYRFDSPEEFLDAGFGEYFNEHSICLVEWPMRAAGFVPPADLCLELQHAGDGRRLVAQARSSGGEACLKNLRHVWGDGSSSVTPAPA